MEPGGRDWCCPGLWRRIHQGKGNHCRFLKRSRSLLGGWDGAGQSRQRKPLCKGPEANTSVEDLERTVVWPLEDAWGWVSSWRVSEARLRCRPGLVGNREPSEEIQQGRGEIAILSKDDNSSRVRRVEWAGSMLQSHHLSWSVLCWAWGESSLFQGKSLQ